MEYVFIVLPLLKHTYTVIRVCVVAYDSIYGTEYVYNGNRTAQRHYKYEYLYIRLTSSVINT